MTDFTLDDLLDANNGVVYLNTHNLGKLGFNQSHFPNFLINMKIVEVSQSINQVKPKQPLLLRYPLDTDQNIEDNPFNPKKKNIFVFSKDDT